MFYHSLGKCKFSDCKHQTESGRAIKEAVAYGDLSRKRRESYIGLKPRQNIRTAKLFFCGKSGSGIRVSQSLTGKRNRKTKNMEVVSIAYQD